MFTTRGPFLEMTGSHINTESISPAAPIQAAPLLAPDGASIPQEPPLEDTPAGLSSSSRPQRKRKREVEGNKELGAHKRPRKTRLEMLPEEQQKDTREGIQNEHEQPPAQPQPRRSTRIQAMNKRRDGVPSKHDIPASPTSRKRAVRKK
jgi:hypothetical protein